MKEMTSGANINGPVFVEEQALEQCEGLVQSIVAKYLSKVKNTGQNEFDDLAQVGRVAVIHACRTFDPNRQTSLPTYAYICIQYAIRKYIRDKGHLIHIPAYIQDQKRYDLIPKRVSKRDSSDNSTFKFGESEVGKGEIDLEDISTDAAPDFTINSEAKVIMEKLMVNLDEADQKLLWMFYGEERTPKEISQIIGVPPATVSRMAAKAIKKLQRTAAYQDYQHS